MAVAAVPDESGEVGSVVRREMRGKLARFASSKSLRADLGRSAAGTTSKWFVRVCSDLHAS